MKIAICDDIPEDRKIIKIYLDEYFRFKNINTKIYEFSSGENFIENFSSEAYQIIFLDIYMDKVTGLETAKHIRSIDMSAAIIFMTTSSEHAVESYDYDAVSYIVKPIDKVKFFHALDKCDSFAAKSFHFIEVMSNRLIERINIKNIQYVEILGRKCVIHTDRNSIAKNTPLNQIENELSNYGFIRANRGSIINPAYVKQLLSEGFQMRDDSIISFSIKEKMKIKQKFLDYCWKYTRE